VSELAAVRWTPYREPLRQTFLRTGGIALIGGAVLARARGDMAHWPLATAVMLWPSLGGHFVELWFLNWLRPRIADGRGVQAVARLAVWFVAGCVFAILMRLTTQGLTVFPLRAWPAWWVGGLAFVGIELVAHLALRLRGHPSFIDARG
jgi:hypothetical protein